MPIDPSTLTALLALRKPHVCAYWKVQWDANDSSQDRYYSDAAYNQMGNFQNVGVAIEPRIIGNVYADTEFEICPDLRTETIPISFTDIDKAITNKFQTFKSGVRCELFFYYPQLDLTYSMWFGQLQAPQVYGAKTLQTVATNGMLSRELTLPRRNKPRECTANHGSHMPSTFASESNGCPVDDHLPGGTIGNGDTECPRDSTATCNLKTGTTDGRYFLGFDTDASATVTDGNTGYIAVSKGNSSALKRAVPVIAGEKYDRGSQLLLWRREANGNTPDHGWVAGIWEICEGPVYDIYSVKVIEKTIEAIHLGIRKGERGQPRYPYAASNSNFSCTAHVFARYGWVNPLSISAPDLKLECRVFGYNKVAVFSDATTYGRQWCDDRIWWLFECYTNQRWGLPNPSSRFEITDWITVSRWSRDTVDFVMNYPDGEDQTFTGRRSIFDARLEPRPAAEQIEDICRSGAISVPFQYEGKHTLAAFRPATTDELTDARVFTDTGSTKNIFWADGQPAITLEQTPDDKIVNEVVMTFEEAINKDVERPITIDDPDQKLKAGRALGEDNMLSVPKRFAAFGCRFLQEVVRLGNRFLRFGEFDEGGTQNNLRATFLTPVRYALGMKRYEVIKIESSLLDPFTVGTIIGGDDFTEAPEYFRVLRMKKVQNGLVRIIAQVYNHTAYTGFETVTVAGTGQPASAPVIIVPPPPPTCVLTFSSTPVYDEVNGVIPVPIDPC